MIDTILSSPNGTLALDGDPVPTTGYLVGWIVSPLIFDREDDDTEDITEFLAHLDNLGIPLVKWWTDEDIEDRIWIDGTDWYGPLSAATVVAQYRGEPYVFDIAANKLIEVEQ